MVQIISLQFHPRVQCRFAVEVNIVPTSQHFGMGVSIFSLPAMHAWHRKAFRNRCSVCCRASSGRWTASSCTRASTRSTRARASTPSSRPAATSSRSAPPYLRSRKITAFVGTQIKINPHRICWPRFVGLEEKHRILNIPKVWQGLQCWKLFYSDVYM